MDIICLDRYAIAKASDMRLAIESLRAAFVDYAHGKGSFGERSIFDPQSIDAGTKLLTMSGYTENPSCLTMKFATVTPQNSQKNNLPLLHAMVAVIDPQTGVINALLEGTSFSAIKTGAMSGLASQLLSPENATTLAIIGCGTQAKTQIDAIAKIRPISTIMLYSRSRKSAESLQQWVIENSELTNDVIVYGTAKHAINNADIISTCTSKTCPLPLFELKDIKPNVHINAIGGASLNAIEIPPQVLQNAQIYVEDREAAMRESNEIRTAIEKGYINKNDILAIGQHLENHQSSIHVPKNITYFRSVGIALQDAAIAQQIIETAKQQGINQNVRL